MPKRASMQSMQGRKKVRKSQKYVSESTRSDSSDSKKKDSYTAKKKYAQVSDKFS